MGELRGSASRLGRMEEENSSGVGVLFALNPETSEWARAGFTVDSNWWVWKMLGVSPKEASPLYTPQLDDASLRSFAARYTSEMLGWETFDVSRVTVMSKLFAFQNSFNEPISGWNTESVKNMDGMFLDAKRFDQSLASWDISQVESMDYMFSGSGISPSNLSETLEGWAQHARTKGVQNYVLLYGLPHTFDDLSGGARNAITFLCSRFGWRINFTR